MGQVLHGSATTTHAIRAAIQRSKATAKELAERHGINPKTVAKWKKRAFVHDAPMGPKDPALGLSEALCKQFPFRVVSSFALLLQRAEEAKRSPNWMANCPMAAVHSMGLRQCTPAFLIARYRSLNAASSVGKLPLVLMIFRKERLSASTQFVV
jgi:transposase-like protein